MEEKKKDPFIVGLKIVIKRDWPTQKSFVENKVTSIVNLSNILRGETGTSKQMRQVLAERAGLSIESIIAIGKGDIPSQSTDNSALGVPFDEDALANIDSSELMSKVNELSFDITERLSTHAKTMGATIHALAKERNRVKKLLQKEQVVSNLIDAAIKVVNKELKITYCNRTYSEKYNQKEGDLCSLHECASCKGKCLASNVLATGKPENTLVEVNDSWFYKTAHPMLSQDGTVHAVLIVSREMTTLLETMREAGWECNYKGKV